ncbi:hypothetical protein DVDV_3799 [Desulfovibrio sp. DV]|nr:hypothetical protein [Desulfovibrio sp. DV]OLN24916.1 hypothetical protein DVDV_3799 [Desulfovibrio sp. DV]
MRKWAKGETAQVNTPAYVRDNIHVSLLAKIYAGFVAGPADTLRPSGYVETQGAFAERFAAAMRARLGLPCVLHLAEQTEFVEPKVRINTDVPDTCLLDWNEDRSWDEMAAYYRRVLTGDVSRGFQA